MNTAELLLLGELERVCDLPGGGGPCTKCGQASIMHSFKRILAAARKDMVDDILSTTDLSAPRMALTKVLVAGGLNCPEDCMHCSGESCAKHGQDECDCDVIDRHQE